MNDFILALFSEEDKLKPSTLYQILIGKRTSSVLCYAFFHGILHLIGIFPTLSEESFSGSLATLKKTGKLQKIDDSLKLTKQPMQDKLNLSEQTVDFFRFGRRQEECWRLVQFLVQATSHLDKPTTYLPLESSPFYTERVRMFIHQHRTSIASSLSEELHLLFSQMTQEQADFLANTLTGFQQNGSVFYQLLPTEAQKEPRRTLTIASATHQFFRLLISHKEFLLYQFLKTVLIQNVNLSMLQTKKLLLAGNSIESVQHIRHLKQGTIQDHIIEWALLEEQFPFEKFLAHHEKLAALPEHSWNYRYKELIELSDLSFLEIRLYQIQQRRAIC